ncbi:MAG: hypothetical protein QGH60_19240 [Phycisphaerae bacterium]|jgi:hypothetical protein|nr:hypothetical protein [Phycisphaerae bacterium]
MTDYYCDIGEETYWQGAAGTTTGDPYTGPAGLQNAIRGTGVSGALSPGDTLYIKGGTGDLSRLVLVDCNGTDVTATGLGWDIGDIVAEASASAWNGYIVETNDGGFLGADDMLLIWLDPGFDETDIIPANGITNATQAQSVTPLADNTTTPGVCLETDGTNAAPIYFVGVDSSWVEDGSLAILDGALKAYTGFRNSAIRTYLEFRNIHTRRTVDSAWAADANLRYCSLVNCIGSETQKGGIGGGGNHIQYSHILHCKAYDNAGGYGFGLYGGAAVNCVAYNNSSAGFYQNIGACVNCVSFENQTGFQLATGADLVNCVADKNSSYGVHTGSPGQSVSACRITNNGTYGIRDFGRPMHDPYCFYSGNGANFETAGIHDDTVRGASTRVTTGVEGYIDNDDATPLADRNYGLTNQAAARRQEAAL